MLDHSQFEVLYTDNVRRVNAYASARLGRDAGEEVTAEVFHAAVVAIRSGLEDSVTPSWLMSVARNKVIDRWRAAGRRRAKAHLLRPGSDETVSFPPDWVNNAKRERVVEALSAMKQRHRMLLVLHHIDGMPIAEIAEAFSQSEHAIESALARARASFRRHYSTTAQEVEL